jgi:hypothetical protein
MKDHIPVKPDRNFAPLLASFLVLLGGLIACVVIVFAGGGMKPELIMMVVGLTLGFGLLLWLLRDKPEAQRRSLYSLMFHRPKKVHHEYSIKRVQRERASEERRPPTLEELREMRDQTRTWVPSSSRYRREES